VGQFSVGVNIGDTSQFIPRTIADLVDSVKATGATVTMTEAYP
jgi:hypothetical protein